VDDVEDFEESEEDDDVDVINEVDTTLDEISGSTSNRVEGDEAMTELEKVARSADVMSKAERLADSAVVETDAELAPNVLTLSNTVLGTSEKVAELVWNVDEFDSAGSAELIDVAVCDGGT
jgi:hypothetical protein